MATVVQRTDPRARPRSTLDSATVPGVEAPPRPDPLDLRGTQDLAPDLLPWLEARIRERRARNLDTYIAVSGREGWGKSALGLQLLLHMQPDYDPHDVIFDKDDYYRVYDPDEKDSYYVFDEAGRLLFNRNWNRRDQKALIQEVMENRKNRNVILLHVPQFKVLDKYAREGRVLLRFSCTSQGQAMIRKLAYNAYAEEAYYPVTVQDHRWLPLEVTHPEFARVYYQRKDERHTSKFHERKRRIKQKQEESENEADYKEARRQRVMDKDGD